MDSSKNIHANNCVKLADIFFRVAVELDTLEAGASKTEDAICDLISSVKGVSKRMPIQELQFQDSMIQSLNCLKTFLYSLASQTPDTVSFDISPSLSNLKLKGIESRLAGTGVC